MKKYGVSQVKRAIDFTVYENNLLQITKIPLYPSYAHYLLKNIYGYAPAPAPERFECAHPYVAEYGSQPADGGHSTEQEVLSTEFYDLKLLTNKKYLMYL